MRAEGRQYLLLHQSHEMPSLLLVLLIASVSSSWAHPDTPLTAYFPSAQNVCLAQVTAIKGGKVVFSVSEVLRGNIDPILNLEPDVDSVGFQLKSEWLLVSCASGDSKDSVGDPMEGYCAWIPGPVIRNGNNVFVKTGAFPSSGIVLDKLPNGSKGLTLEHIKELLTKQATPKA